MTVGNMQSSAGGYLLINKMLLQMFVQKILLICFIRIKLVDRMLDLIMILALCMDLIQCWEAGKERILIDMYIITFVTI
jgi:hypothetical protein